VTGRFDGLRALVVGLGVSGAAAARVLLEEGAAVRVTEARSAGELDLANPGPLDPRIELRTGGHRPEDLDGIDVVVVSPGVPERAPILSWALERGVDVWSELELGARLCSVPVIGVTGTNGKTTTVELVASMLRAAGMRARACGNVGHPFSVAAREGYEALVVEASSFQLRFHRTFRPRVSVLLNLAPDHLDWHGTFAGYAEAKARIFERQAGEDVHVGNADDPAAAEVSRRAPCRHLWFARDGGTAAGVDAWVREGAVVASWDGMSAALALPPGATPAFAMDAAAATMAALAFGVDGHAVQSGLLGAEPLPHRGAVVATIDGVRFVDDSKATNPHATLASLEGRADVTLVAGGLAKGVDLSPLRAAAPSLMSVVALGEAAAEIERVFEGLVPVARAASIEEAVRRGFDAARPGGTVLLAPACASQDMFRDYRERGDRFAAAARQLRQSAETGGRRIAQGSGRG
jgi:UDP-N-acetylmuramoylalanine--D-glutamate ligase